MTTLKENDVEEYRALIEKLEFVNNNKFYLRVFMNKETECVEIHILFSLFGIEFGGTIQMIKAQ